MDLNENSPTYGYIKNSSKVKWQNYDLLGHLKKELDLPIFLDTDVNAAAIGEARWGAARDLDSCIYVTVGTGIGVGAFVEGKLLHGLTHPEMGHILVQKHESDHFEGVCPFHPSCLEGIASGPAIEKRWGKKAAELRDWNEVWDLEAFYLAQALMNYTLILSPKKIILGGGVMHQKQLYPKVCHQLSVLLNEYIQHPVLENLEQYISAPALGENSGLCGAFALTL